MSLEDSNDPPSAPKWQRLPLAAKRELRQAIQNHLDEHGATHYEAVRNDARFSRWFGTHLGYRGEKRFDRMVNEVRGHRATKANRSARGAQARTDQSEGEAFAPQNHAQHKAEVIDTGVISYAELQDTLRRQRISLERAVADCFNPDGVLTEPKLHAQLSRELRGVVRDSQNLIRQSVVTANSQAFVVGLTRRFLELSAGNPEQLATLQAAVNDTMQDHSGLAATGKFK